MKVAYFVMPAHGHVNPNLPLIAELTRRGESVDAFATEEFRSNIEATGARFRAFEPEIAAHFQKFDSSHGIFSLSEISATMAAQLLAPLKAELAREGHRYVVHDSMAVWGRLVAQAGGLPRATTFPSFGSRPETIPLPPWPVLLLALGPRKLPRNLRHVVQRRRLAREIARTHGVDELVFKNVISNPSHCNIVFTSRMFQGPIARPDDTFHFVGPTLAHRPPDPTFPLERLEGRRVVYASLGTVFNSDASFFRKCAEAFRGRDEVLVLSLGKTIDPASLGALADNVIARSHVPQLDVLRRASAFITHAGMNGVSESLSLGVPLLVYPQAADQFLVARRVKELGVGVRLSRAELEPARLVRAVERVLADETMRARVREVGESLRSGGGASRAADVLMAWRDGAVPP